jgi:DNA topoisomerase I
MQLKEAIQHPRDIDDNLRRAQEARRVLDRLVGYDLSGLIWKKVRYGLSAGRVQSPALRIIMEREREIRAFVPELYYVVTADTKTEKKAALPLICTEEIKDKKEAERIVEVGKKAAWSVVDIQESEAKRSPRPPFITSTLQQAASTRLGYSPSRTMGLAQKLYEGGHITYMRTDSVNLSKVAVAEALKVIASEFGKEYPSERTYASKSKNAQEAHEAIRPTRLAVEYAGANEDEKKLYNLIRARTLASQMVDARTARTKILAQGNIGTTVAKEKLPEFSANGSRVIFDGWLKADPDARGEDVELPLVKKGEKLDVLDVVSEEKSTEPPSRYTEAGLIKELEKRGIGRPSTYASIIRTLEERAYVEKVNKALVPTDTGDVVSSFIEENFASYISDDFTATMEDQLDNIAIGKAEYEENTSTDFYGPFTKAVQSKEHIEKLTNLGEADARFVCPKCGSPMTIKLSRNGKFLSCAKYPECTGALTLDGKDIQTDIPLGTDPATGLSIYKKVGKYGPYVQLGEGGKDPKTKKAVKPRMASIPKTKNPEDVTLEEALVYLTLPRALGAHPDTGKMITANVGRFGPYIVHDADFRSLKTDDVYTIPYERALEILREPKKVGRGRWAKEENRLKTLFKQNRIKSTHNDKFCPVGTFFFRAHSLPRFSFP